MTISTASPVPRVVADHYEIVQPEPIGRGGMAFVYRGRDLRTRRDVALKTLKPEWVNDPAARARFRHEARMMAFLTHPNVARVFDLFDPDDLSPPWVVLEFIPGPSLRQEIDRHGTIDIDRTAHLLKQIAAALDHLHKRGMVHLDVKPQNILFAEPMTVKLIDFGIAQRSYTVPELINGQNFGTVAYLSPEQATGEVVGPASDVYSLGCVVYEMITGQPPFPVQDDLKPADIVQAHASALPINPSDVDPAGDMPDWIDDVVLDALRKDPEARYATTTGFADAFEGALNAASPPDSTVPLGDLPRFDPRRNPVVVQDNAPRPVATRRSAPLVTRVPTRFLWKLVAILALGNLLLAGLSWLDRGAIPGVYVPEPAIEDATHVRVTADLLNVRAEPDEGAIVIGQLQEGNRVAVTGDPADGWVPVTYTFDGQDVDGWVAAEHVEAMPLTGVDRIRAEVESWLP